MSSPCSLRPSEEARSRAAELDDLLQSRGRAVSRGAGAGHRGGFWATFDWTATVDAGSRDGLAPDMTVLSGDGLVGRVTTSDP